MTTPTVLESERKGKSGRWRRRMIERARGKKQVTETGGKTREEEEEDEKERRGNPDLYVICKRWIHCFSSPLRSFPFLPPCCPPPSSHPFLSCPGFPLLPPPLLLSPSTYHLTLAAEAHGLLTQPVVVWHPPTLVSYGSLSELLL